LANKKHIKSHLVQIKIALSLKFSNHIDKFSYETYHLKLLYFIHNLLSINDP